MSITKFLINFIVIITLYCLLVTPIRAQSKEEQAVYNMNQLLVPASVITDKPISADQNIVSQFLSFIGQKKDEFLGLFWGQNISNPAKLFGQSEGINNAYVPGQIQPLETDPFIEQEKRFLGTQTGVYGVSLPTLADRNNRDIKTDERDFECSIVPCDQGIRPITP